MITRSQVKYIQSLNEKKFRTEAGVFVAEGPKIINEFLACSNVQPLQLYATAEWHEEVVKPNISSVEITIVTDSELERISFLSTPHQVIGIFRQPAFDEAPGFANTIVLLLDGIQDPGNFGTIIRIADWFGLRQLVAGRDCVDVFNPKVVQSTMASIARVKVVYEDLKVFIRENDNMPVYASSLNGKHVSSFGKIKEGVLLIGNESKGIKQELIKTAHHQITIPRIGAAESLNAAVATGIILSHIVSLSDER